MLRLENYNLSHSRVDRIVTGFLNDDPKYATHMGLWDRFKDLFRGGAKQKAVEEAFIWISEQKEYFEEVSDKGTHSGEEKTLSHFLTLDKCITSNKKDLLRLTVDVQKDSWTYQITLDDEVIGEGKVSSDAYKTRNSFLATAFLSNLEIALRSKMSDEDALSTIDDIKNEFEEMDETADAKTMKSPSFFAKKVEHAISFVKELAGESISFDVCVEIGARSTAKIFVAGKDVCTISDYGLSDFESFADWHQYVQSMAANRSWTVPRPTSSEHRCSLHGVWRPPSP